MDESGDEGLAMPRTSLAWRRTSLACLAMALISSRTTLGGQAAGTVAGSISVATVVTVAMVGVLVVSRARTRGVADSSRTRDGRVLLATSLAIVLLAVTELVTGATGR